MRNSAPHRYVSRITLPLATLVSMHARYSTIVLVLLLASIAMPAASQTIPPYVPTNGLVGWWPFNGNANDESGNGNDGVVTSATLTSDRDNNENRAYKFDHQGKMWGQRNKEIYIPYSTQYNVEQITVSVWICPRSYFWPVDSNNPNSTIVRRYEYGYANPSGETWGLDFNAESVSCFIRSVDRNAAVAKFEEPLRLNRWYHVAMSYNGTELVLYVDGVMVAKTETTLKLNTAGRSGISVGVSRQANGYWVDADAIIDEIGFWSRALSQWEVKALHGGFECEPVITQQPQSLIRTPAQSASFTVATYGLDTITAFRWQTQVLGLPWTSLEENKRYIGVTTRSLNVPYVESRQHQQRFRVLAYTGDLCTDTSDVATLTMTDTCTVTSYDTVLISVTDTLFITIAPASVVSLDSIYVKVYPNPSSSHVVIETEQHQELAGWIIVITDVVGRTMYRGALTDPITTVSLKTLAGPGQYYLLLQDEKDQIRVTKVIVLR